LCVEGGRTYLGRSAPRHGIVTEGEAIHPDRAAEVSKGRIRSCSRQGFQGTPSHCTGSSCSLGFDGKPSSGGGKADYLLTSDSLWDLFPQQNRCWLGYCLLNSSGRLTGECIAASLQGACCIKYRPAQCPPGRKARAPSNFSCQIRQVARVDAARRCTAH
jgi:hypothetical protein